MNILFTICARAGSKGVKSKNSRQFLGYPLAYYTLVAYRGFLEKYGQKYGKINLALNTDSDILLNQCENTNIDFTYIPRTSELGGDKIAKADVICDTLKKMEAKTGMKYGIVLDLDLTSPLRTSDDIEGCIQKLLAFPQANVSYSVTQSRRQPHFNLVLEDEEGYLQTAIASHYTTRQDAPQSYDMNASIYAYRREPLLKTKEQDVFDGKCVGWIMKDTAILDIDSEEDYELMQVVAEYFYQTDGNMRQIKEGIPAILIKG